MKNLQDTSDHIHNISIAYLEPFNGGSHAYFTRAITQGVQAHWRLGLLPGRHWKWRMRGSGVYFAQQQNLWEPLPQLLFASAFVPLADLMALQPALSTIPRVVYFHENQLSYPFKEALERDTHFGFTQLVSARAATCCVFNSAYNRDSFLQAGQDLLTKLPDARPTGWIEDIAAKSHVIGVPLELPPIHRKSFDGKGPIILWNHRWEHDKNPKAFFDALRVLFTEGIPFRVIVCGEQHRQQPPEFEEARQWLGPNILHWGFVEDRKTYWDLLAGSDIVVSTAHQEFFGISVLEAVHAGALPVVPDRLSYRELLSDEWRYKDQAALIDRLKNLCTGQETRKVFGGAQRFRAVAVCDQFERLFAALLKEI